MVATCDEKIIIRRILVSEGKLCDMVFKRLEEALVYKKNRF